ncbi:dihydropyrimidine dehydrogenase subunit A [Fictibacillus macauensis ZFHKF-1]|uniref:Dihydropyrimidine dehydrogenase subunit A n=1 Tax=Fictibacillus macauensis ZFHKF-1 TaxID=1196324 RepID=I8UIE5_9BACL|nr:NAD(P)-dependent oxidoreductase [Fictibacillus macauensis]EIT86665.1 dihydropyrimidine dehydrogenase subunit A [Fictibacillus macauensis ZFHKF-1]
MTKSKNLRSLVNVSDNFREVECGLTDVEASDEANRCLYCYDAPCITACPTSINIPSFIKSIATTNVKGAAKTIMTANPIGASCARVCPTEELCEGACVLNHSSKPILIGKLQRYATDWAMKRNEPLFKAGEPNGRSVAIVGSGPAGLSAARELARFGYKVTIYEAKSEAGGLNTYGIVSFRLPPYVSLWEAQQVKALGVTIKTNTAVGKDIAASELMKQYDAVVIACGMSHVPMLGIEGETLSGVHDAIRFVEQTKTEPLSSYVGKKVAVIGAGNTAIDAATCAMRLGADSVKILYRRTVEEMTAYHFEYEFAKQEGVEFRFLTSPQKIIANERGEVKELECVRMTLGEPDAKGRKAPVAVAGSEFTMDVDIVIKAIGQTRHHALIEAFGLEHHHGVVAIDQHTLQTSVANVFACGDVIFGDGQGEAMVVSAAQQGKVVANSIHQRLASRQVTTH